MVRRLLCAVVVFTWAGAAIPGCHKSESAYHGPVSTLCAGLDSFLTLQLHLLEQGEDGGFSHAVPNLLIQQMGFCALVRDVGEKEHKKLTELSSEFSKTAVDLGDRIFGCRALSGVVSYRHRNV